MSVVDPTWAGAVEAIEARSANTAAAAPRLNLTITEYRFGGDGASAGWTEGAIPSLTGFRLRDTANRRRQTELPDVSVQTRAAGRRRTAVGGRQKRNRGAWRPSTV